MKWQTFRMTDLWFRSLQRMFGFVVVESAHTNLLSAI